MFARLARRFTSRRIYIWRQRYRRAAAELEVARRQNETLWRLVEAFDLVARLEQNRAAKAVEISEQREPRLAK